MQRSQVSSIKPPSNLITVWSIQQTLTRFSTTIKLTLITKKQVKLTLPLSSTIHVTLSTSDTRKVHKKLSSILLRLKSFVLNFCYGRVIWMDPVSYMQPVIIWKRCGVIKCSSETRPSAKETKHFLTSICFYSVHSFCRAHFKKRVAKG